MDSGTILMGSKFRVVSAMAYKIAGKKSTGLERGYDCRYIGALDIRQGWS